jgi:hypothetical protein
MQNPRPSSGCPFAELAEQLEARFRQRAAVEHGRLAA